MNEWTDEGAFKIDVPFKIKKISYEINGPLKIVF